MNAAHYSDASLISLLDGELPAHEARDVAAHLDRCWSCRSRSQELENAIATVGDLFRDADAALHGPSTTAFLSRIPNTSPRPTFRPIRPALLFVAALAAAAAVTRFVVLLPEKPPPARAIAVPSQPLPLTPLPTLLPMATLAPTPILPKTAQQPDIAPLNPAPLDLDEVELEFRFRLHQSGADLRDTAIAIGQQDGMVVVHGVAENPAQGLELLQAVAAIPHPDAVRIDLRLPGETPAQATTTVPDAVPPARHPDPPSLKPWIPLVGNEARLTDAGNQAVAIAEKMTDTAWALRHLEERFPSADRLSERALHLRDTLAADYRARIQAQAAEMATHLAFFPSCSADFSRPAIRFSEIDALRDLVEWLFAGRQLDTSPASIDEAARDICTKLHNPEEK